MKTNKLDMNKKVCRNCGGNFFAAKSSNRKYCSPLCYRIDVLVQMEEYREFKQELKECMKDGRICDDLD
jgi:hypothetical protein